MENQDLKREYGYSLESGDTQAMRVATFERVLAILNQTVARAYL
jgi:hypothetical protein